MYLSNTLKHTLKRLLTSYLVFVQKLTSNIQSGDTKSLSRRTKTSHCRETRLSDFDTNKLTKHIHSLPTLYNYCFKCLKQIHTLWRSIYCFSIEPCRYLKQISTYLFTFKEDSCFEKRIVHKICLVSRFNQLLNIKVSSKLMHPIEARALIYQGILITSDVAKKIELMNALKNSFINEEIEEAFDEELQNFLKKINLDEVPSNYTTFYNRYLNEKN